MKFSEFPKAVIDENVDYTVREITNVIKKYGPRESGNDNCYATQKHIKKEMDIFADETGFETYKMAPKAFLHFTKTVSLAIIFAVVICLALTFLGMFDNIVLKDTLLSQFTRRCSMYQPFCYGYGIPFLQAVLRRSLQED